MPIHAVIFDMDGLMVDTEPYYWEVARAMAARRGRTVPDDVLRQMMGRSRLESMEVFRQALGLAESAESLLAERELAMLDRFARGVEPMPGLRELLDGLERRGVRRAVCTSSPAKFTDVLLPAIGVAGRFDVVQTGDGITRGKPDPEIYLRCLSRLGLAGPDAVVLEDTEAGCRAAHAAGCRVIAVPTHLTAGQDFSFCAARVPSLHDAAGLLGRWLDEVQGPTSGRQ
ncbi:MAG: HAD family hydrolase [Tepidisphaerales bacterium]